MRELCQYLHPIFDFSIFRAIPLANHAADQVTGAKLSALSTLLTKSLIRRNDTGRYDLHEMIRQYAREQLTKVDKLGETSD